MKSRLNTNNTYSLFSIIKGGFKKNSVLDISMSNKTPKKNYDVIVIGGGGHGMATAYYLAKNHGITNIAVVEKGLIGRGNTGRNTQVVRSNYLWTESSLLYEHSLKLWNNLSQDLNFNVMYTKRGVFSLAHSYQEARDVARRVTANKLNGIDSLYLTPKEIKEYMPIINISPTARYPIFGASLQKRGGTVHHDAVAWGFARRLNQIGVDIVQNCEVRNLIIKNNIVNGISTDKGDIFANKIAVAVAGSSTRFAEMGNFKLPIESHPLQAWVSEPIKPILNPVVMSNAVHAYVSQAEKGELVIGAGIDKYIGYSQRGSFNVIENATSAIIELFPAFSKVKLLRTWAGLVDVSPDACPIIGNTPVKNLYINCGWGTGCFKATPGSGYVFAHTIANDKPHILNEAFSLDRFASGKLIDEHGAAGVAH